MFLLTYTIHTVHGIIMQYTAMFMIVGIIIIMLGNEFIISETFA